MTRYVRPRVLVVVVVGLVCGTALAAFGVAIELIVSAMSLIALVGVAIARDDILRPTTTEPRPARQAQPAGDEA